MKHIAVITGASSGIGKQFAITLKDQGTFDEVWVIARRADRLEQLKTEIPFPVKAISLDLSDKESFRRLESELGAFVRYYDKQWGHTKKKIRKDILNLKNLKG